MHTTFITQRALRLADFSPVPDEKMVGAAPEFFWDRRHQLLLHAFHCFVLGKPSRCVTRKTWVSTANAGI